MVPALTTAELAVARLVADGRTNREVADRLFLSPHTVNSHLRHVFTKLGINSRVDLAPGHRPGRGARRPAHRRRQPEREARRRRGPHHSRDPRLPRRRGVAELREDLHRLLQRDTRIISGEASPGRPPRRCSAFARTPGKTRFSSSPGDGCSCQPRSRAEVATIVAVTSALLLPTPRENDHAAPGQAHLERESEFQAPGFGTARPSVMRASARDITAGRFTRRRRG